MEIKEFQFKTMYANTPITITVRIVPDEKPGGTCG
jgi:hypothetical protein